MSLPGLRDRAGNLKGTDFLHFYTLGSLALAHDGADLYSLRAQSATAAARVPSAAGIFYLPLYPPQVSILFAPLARLSYATALSIWIAFSALIYALCCYVVWGACPNLRREKTTVVILALGFPAFWHLIAWGQSSALALACFTLAFCAFRSRRDFLAGLALGCLIFKPQLALGAAIVFVCTLRWRVIAGAFVSASAQLIAGWVYWGGDPFRNWIETLMNARKQFSWLEPRPYQTHCLRTFWTMLLPWPVVSFTLYVFSGIVISIFAIICWRRRMPLSVRFSALLFATVLLAPHLTVYDLVILAPAFILLSDWILAQPDERRSRHLALLLYLAFVLPLVGPLARWTHFQASVPVMASILYFLWHCGRSSPERLSVPEHMVKL
ncbi:MAG: glycosyltransferase family 87 protein [Candidatus Sulfotelmatobacter sp.]